MYNRIIKTIFFYSMIGLVGIVLLFAGIMYQVDKGQSNRMIWAGVGLIATAIIFLIITLLVRKRQKSDKGYERLYDSYRDERNVYINGRSSSITHDIMLVLGILIFSLLGFCGMYSYAYIVIGYVIISSVLQLGVSIYLHSKC